MDARPEFATILDVLSQHGVSFIVVGGVAAVLSGAPVNTLDTEVLVERSPENLERLLAALVDLDAIYRDPAHRRIEPTVERLKGDRAIASPRYPDRVSWRWGKETLAEGAGGHFRLRIRRRLTPTLG